MGKGLSKKDAEAMVAHIKNLESRLKEARKWMGHEISCDLFQEEPHRRPEGTCTCGLDEFLKK